MNREKKISIYLFIVLLVSQSGMQLPFLSFMKGNNQIILAGLLWFVGYFLFHKRNKLAGHLLAMKLFGILLSAIIISTIMAYSFWGQDFITSILLYRHNIWIIYLPLILYIKPTQRSISSSLFAFTVLSLSVWLGQIIGIIPVTLRESIWGEVIDEVNEFGGRAVYGIRIITFAFYLFLAEMAYKFTKKNLIKVLVTFITIVFASQRALLLFALPIMAYTFIFKVNIKRSYKTAIAFLFMIAAIVFFVQTSDIWISFIEETVDQLGDKDYNRWMAVDYFLNNYNSGPLTVIFGNGFLSMHNYGGRLIHELGYRGIFIDDIGMLGVWVRYGVIPILVTYYIIIKVVKAKNMPLFMRFICIHIGLLPTAWTLIGPHIFVLILMIYFYCINIEHKAKYITIPNNSR